MKPEVNVARLRDDLLALLAIPSPALHEGAVMSALASRIEAAGFACEFDDAGAQLDGETGNLLVRVPGSVPGAEPLFLNAHVDTVPPCVGVEPVEREGIIYSAGDTVLGADDKTGVVTILEAARTVTEQDVPHGPLELVFTVAEETGLQGAKCLDVRRLKSSRGYVFDGSARIGHGTLGAPSHDNLTVTVRGKAAHAGIHPEEGVNAIVLTAQALARMKFGRLDEESTANVGIIAGGQATNIVPEEVVVQCEARSHNPERLRTQIEAMQEAFTSVAARGGGSAECTLVHQYRAFVVDEEDLLVVRASQAASRLGLTPHWKRSGGGSDANVFNERGLKTVILNCGQQHPHTTQECTAVRDVVTATKLAVTLIELFARPVP